MDFLNQATGQLRELMLSMTPAARVTALLLLGVIGVSMGYLVQHQTGSPDVDLFNGKILTSYEVTRADTAIAEAGLEGHVVVGNRIKVPAGRKSEFLAAVASGDGLPREFHKILDEALNLSPFASGDTRRGKWQGAREEQLSMLVSDMEGIEYAKVMFDVVEAKGLGRNGTATATVIVQPAVGETFGPHEMKRVQKTVAGGIGLLKPEQVVVTNVGGSSYGGEEAAAASFDEPYLANLSAYEKWITDKIAAQLRHIPGVQVGVSAKLETILEHTTQIMAPEGEPVVLRADKDDTDDEISEAANGGRVGLTAQAPNSTNKDNPTVTVVNKHRQNITQDESTVGQKAEFLRQAGLVPEEVRVSVSVPANYVLNTWKEGERRLGNDPEQTKPDVAILDSLKTAINDDVVDTVVKLIPKELAANKDDLISVIFPTLITPEAIEGPSMASQALGWASKNFNTMTMAVVALISLMLLRSMVKSIPAAEAAAALGPSLALDTVDGRNAPNNASSAESDADSEGGKRPKLRLKKGESLKDDLVEIVREDPDAAAAILRSWIGNAG